MIYSPYIAGAATRAKVLAEIHLSLAGCTRARGARRESYKETLRSLRATLVEVGACKVDAPLLARLARLLD